MVTFHGELLVRLLVVMAVMQGALLLIARGLGTRLPRTALLVGLLLPVGFLAPWLFSNRLLVPNDVLLETVPGAPWVEELDPHGLLNDAVYQFLPWELEVRHALSAKRLPLWSDVLEGGSSPWSNPQAGVLSPIAMLSRAFHIQHHLLASLALKILVGLQGTWLLAKALGGRGGVPLLAGVSFALGGGVMAWSLYPHTSAVVWVPWLSLAVIRLFRRPSPTRVATTAILAAILLLSGHPEVAFAGSLFAGLCGLALRKRRPPLTRGLVAVLVAAVLGCGLAAPVLVPFLHLLPGAQRAAEALALRRGAVYWSPGSWFPADEVGFLLAPTNPLAFGRPYEEPFTGPYNWAEFEAGYTGLVAFAGGVVALVHPRRRRLWPLLGFALASLLLASEFVPFLAIARRLPLFRLVAYQRFLLLGSLALSLAGCLALDFYVLRRVAWRSGVALAVAATLSLAVRGDLHVVLLWSLIGLGALLSLRSRRAALGALTLAAVLDLAPWAWLLQPRGHPELFYPRSRAMEVIVEESRRGGPWRAVGEDFAVYASLLPVYGVAEVRPHNPLAQAAYLRVLDAAFAFRPTRTEYFASFRNVDHPFLDFLGVRVVVSYASMPPPRSLERIDAGEFEPFRLFRNPDAMPRYFLPTAAEVISRGQISAWVSGLGDPRRVSLLREEVGSWQPPRRPWDRDAVRVSQVAPGQLVVETPPQGEKLLATSLPGPRGWRVRGSAGELERLTVNGAFLAVRVPDGVDRFELVFLPPGFLLGVAGALLAGAVVLALLVVPDQRVARIFPTLAGHGD